jgi:hypothetical protein
MVGGSIASSRQNHQPFNNSAIQQLPHQPMLYRIAEPADWQQAQQTGFFVSPDLVAEGFIHSSERAQILETARRYYAGRTDLVLLEWDEDALIDGRNTSRAGVGGSPAGIFRARFRAGATGSRAAVVGVCSGCRWAIRIARRFVSEQAALHTTIGRIVASVS